MACGKKGCGTKKAVVKKAKKKTKKQSQYFSFLSSFFAWLRSQGGDVIILIYYEPHYKLQPFFQLMAANKQKWSSGSGGRPVSEQLEVALFCQQYMKKCGYASANGP